MKIILSRKGFDSSAGKIPSAIIGTKLISFPIPNEKDDKDSYDGLKFTDDSREVEEKYSKIIIDLYNKKSDENIEYKNKYLGEEKHCHVDPDIRENVRKKIIKNWEPIFGQSGSSATYLIDDNPQMINGNLKVEIGDIFLFFGNYREVEFDFNKDKYKYKRGSKEQQLIWGWLVVDDIIDNPTGDKYEWHPHTYDDNTKYKEKNILFKAAKEIVNIGEFKIPGFGVFDYKNEERILTAPKEINPNNSKALWKYNKIYDVENTKHDERKNSSSNPKESIYYAGQWQELILNNFDSNKTIEWLRKIFKDVILK